MKNILVALFCLAVCTVCVLADTLRLKDGTVLEGKVIEQPDRYWIKLADGTSKTVLKKDVLKLERGGRCQARQTRHRHARYTTG
jgi:hypothetical protein